MYCSGCGSKIPFAGAVCPNCLRDKSNDQQVEAIFFMCGGLGMMLGYLTSDYFGLSFVQWFFGGAGIGLFCAMLIAASTSKSRKTEAPEVRQTDRRG